MANQRLGGDCPDSLSDNALALALSNWSRTWSNQS